MIVEDDSKDVCEDDYEKVRIGARARQNEYSSGEGINKRQAVSYALKETSSLQCGSEAHIWNSGPYSDRSKETSTGTSQISI